MQHVFSTRSFNLSRVDLLWSLRLLCPLGRNLSLNGLTFA
jgi:hypothetical protein